MGPEQNLLPVLAACATCVIEPAGIVGLVGINSRLRNSEEPFPQPSEEVHGSGQLPITKEWLRQRPLEQLKNDVLIQNSSHLRVYEACGEIERCQRAILDKELPLNFVRWYFGKYCTEDGFFRPYRGMKNDMMALFQALRAKHEFEALKENIEDLREDTVEQLTCLALRVDSIEKAMNRIYERRFMDVS